ncbi:peptidase C39 family protein [Anaerolineales bacterium HSG6]|nr:peptidase C39 family protein [Anaerolineales bacterium HSG6]
MPKCWLTIPHQKQRRQADCLASCAAMVLSYWKRSVSYEKLMALLDIQDLGAPYSNIRRLNKLGMSVMLAEGELTDLESHLQQGDPCIVFLRTGELSYWHIDTGHAVVVTGIDDDFVYLNDPAFAIAPQTISHGEFFLGWLEFDYEYAVVKPK